MFQGKTLRCSLSQVKHRLFIGNVPKNLTEEELRKMLDETGPGVENIECFKVFFCLMKYELVDNETSTCVLSVFSYNFRIHKIQTGIVASFSLSITTMLVLSMQGKK